MPYTIPDDSNYQKELEAKLNCFIGIIDSLSENNDDFSVFLTKFKETYTSIISAIKDTINEYLAGNYGRAYTIFSEALDKEEFSKYFNKLREPIDHNFPLYRTRLSDESIDKKEEIFHIPYNKRHLIKPQRYSLAGVPCLYLGSSLYVCWLEMDKPDLNKLYLSRFQIEKECSISVLNLAHPYGQIISGQTEDMTLDNLCNIFSVFPLILACSFKKQHKNAHFNIEYIIPNLLLEWVNNNQDVQGIKYRTTKDKSTKNTKLMFSYVFPATSKLDFNSTDKYNQELIDIFSFTEPVSWQLLSTTMPPSLIITTPPNITSINQMMQNNDYYGSTSFGQNEERLNTVPISKLNI
jgi:hypothetical protein